LAGSGREMRESRSSADDFVLVHQQKANFVGNALLDERERYFLKKPGAETDMNVATPAWTTPRLHVFA